ncbi:MAG: nuclear transport factor 2 family protein [Thermoleophilaceae bacterium]|nr:nuclear transport factor 2 family protein [Thermoleophilaceae bacterium]
MSEENAEEVRRIIEAFGRGDFHAALQNVRMEVRTHRIAPLPDPKAYIGPAGMLMAWGEWAAPYEDLELTVGELTEVGHSVVAEIRQRGRRTADHEVTEERFWFVCTFFEGELTQWDMLASKRQALNGLARVEKPPPA